MSGNKFAKLIRLGSDLGIDLDGLRDIAYTYTNQYSLRSLKVKQRQEIERKLQYRIKQAWQKRNDQVKLDFQPANITIAQKDFFVDLITDIFKSTDEFRTWLKTYFNLDHERFIDHIRASSIIKALTDMRSRRFKTYAPTKRNRRSVQTR